MIKEAKLPDSQRIYESSEKGTYSSKRRPSVVIIGAGFGGLEAARALAKTNADVIVVDKKNHHCFQPLLYQVATAALSSTDIAWPVRSILSDRQNVTVLMAEVNAVDMETRTVATSEGPRLPFDYLIIATGVTTSYFNHPEWAAHAAGLRPSKMPGRYALGYSVALSVLSDCRTMPCDASR